MRATRTRKQARGIFRRGPALRGAWSAIRPIGSAILACSLSGCLPFLDHDFAVVDGGASGDAGRDGGTERDACVERVFYADLDGDGYGNASAPIRACELPSEASESSDDCDDGCAACHPGGSESCGDDTDEDCSGAVDDGCPCTDGATRSCGTDEGECVAGTQQCVSAAWGTCEDATEPAADVCNGLDDDCDGTVDGAAADAACASGVHVVSATCSAGSCELACDTVFLDCTAADGCETDSTSDPAHCGACDSPCEFGCSESACEEPRLVLTPAADTTLRGVVGGSQKLDDCPAGELPTGIEAMIEAGYYNGTLTQYRTFCSTVALVNSGSGYALSFGPGSTVPATGARGSATYTTGVTMTASCPAGSVIVGFEGRAGSQPALAMNAIAIRCAPLAISGTSVTIGSATTQPVVGSTSGTAFGPTDCATGTIARGALIFSGEILDGYALRCATPSLE
jgi:hypothetical protein